MIVTAVIQLLSATEMPSLGHREMALKFALGDVPMLPMQRWPQTTWTCARCERSTCLLQFATGTAMTKLVEVEILLHAAFFLRAKIWLVLECGRIFFTFALLVQHLL